MIHGHYCKQGRLPIKAFLPVIVQRGAKCWGGESLGVRIACLSTWLRVLQVQRIAIEQQLASGDFSLQSSGRKLKKQRVDSISQVWQWLGQQQALEPKAAATGAATSPPAIAAPLPVLEHASSC